MIRAAARDVALVARFEVVRAVRTWRALALVVLYLVATAGGAKTFVSFLGSMERRVALTLRVPPTDRPGAMTERLLREGGELRSVLDSMVGDEQLVRGVLSHPVLAIFHLWLGLLLLPFLAAMNAAESISTDLQTRALRFEAQRTGRWEIVLGRFAGQLALSAVASLLAALATWTVGMIFMVHQSPGRLVGSLLALGFRAWCFGVPFIGVAIGCSQLTASPAWARVLAVVATGGSWILYGVASTGAEEWRAGIVWDALLQALPQGWMRGLWLPGTGWMASALVCVVFGLAASGAGYLRFAHRDL